MYQKLYIKKKKIRMFYYINNIKYDENRKLLLFYFKNSSLRTINVASILENRYFHKLRHKMV